MCENEKLMALAMSFFIFRKEYSTKDARLFGKISAVSYVFLELTPEDAGKVLTMEVVTDFSYSDIFTITERDKRYEK